MAVKSSVQTDKKLNESLVQFLGRYATQKYENVLLHWLQMQKLYNCSVFRV